MTAEAPTPVGALTLDTRLTGVLGGRTAQSIERAFGYRTVGDLLAHYPRRYAMRGELTALESLPLDENVTIVAEVLEVTERPMRQRKGSIVEAKISDGTGILTLTFFNQKWRANDLRPGRQGVFAGKVGAYKGVRQLAHPDYELFDEVVDATSPEAKRWAEAPIPIYPATSTIASWQLQKTIALVLEGLGAVEDPIPGEVRSARSLLAHRDALHRIHQPEREADWKAARRTLRFTEAFVLQTALLQRRAELRTRETTARRPAERGFLARFDAALPFPLTGDQRDVGGEIARDLAEPVPMNRLVQGEVGSGKTLVALRAMLAVADSGGQSALLAPTEVLAAQHLRSIAKVLGPELAAELVPTLITGQLSAAERRKALLRAAAGQSRIVVGTHALMGERVSFADLGLVVVDEQHRFGVDQREALRLKGEHPPHVLVLTATPIPRTVAMTVFGDLDVSTIHELPAGRAGIESHVVPLALKPGWRSRVWERLAEEVELGRQGFVVCPAIDPTHGEAGDVLEPDADAGSSGLQRAGDGADAGGPAGAASGGAADAAGDAAPGASVSTVLAELRAHPRFADRRVEPLHGRMPADEKDAVMRAFAAGEIDVLVATTVIEVGVDVPNASAMVVLDADRFGVSQLHQLRGRVGRGSVPGLCLLVTRAMPGSVALQRVEAVAATLDGFELARVDLELRQEGDVLGSSQSGGRSSLKLLRVVRDGDLIADARELAREVVDADPALASHGALAGAVRRRLDDETGGFLNKG